MEKRILMKWLQNPLSEMGRYRIKKAWWRLVAAKLHKENRDLLKMMDNNFDEWEQQEDKITELEEEVRELQWFRDHPLQNGYWRVNDKSYYRINNKFVEWYEKWYEQVQSKLEFRYERDETKAEKERRDKTHLEEYDERYDD